MCATITHVDKQTHGCVTVWLTLSVSSHLFYLIFTRRNHWNRTGFFEHTRFQNLLLSFTILAFVSVVRCESPDLSFSFEIKVPGSGQSGDSREVEMGDWMRGAPIVGTRIKDL